MTDFNIVVNRFITFFKRTHKCNFKKPIISRYINLNRREIVFECKCGKCENRIERIDLYSLLKLNPDIIFEHNL
jgi:hypothetical protein